MFSIDRYHDKQVMHLRNSCMQNYFFFLKHWYFVEYFPEIYKILFISVIPTPPHTHTHNWGTQFVF